MSTQKKTNVKKLKSRIAEIHSSFKQSPEVFHMDSPLGLSMLIKTINYLSKDEQPSLINQIAKPSYIKNGKVFNAFCTILPKIKNVSFLSEKSWSEIIKHNYFLIEKYVTILEKKKLLNQGIFKSTEKYRKFLLKNAYRETRYPTPRVPSGGAYTFEGRTHRYREHFLAQGYLDNGYAYTEAGKAKTYLQNALGKYSRYRQIKNSFKALKSLSGEYYYISEKVWIFSVLPKISNLLINDKKSSTIKYNDGASIYEINNINMEEGLFNRIKDDKIIPEDYLHRNIELRRMVFEVAGGDKMMKIFNNPKSLGKSAKTGYELFKVNHSIFNGATRFFIKYKCPSTGRIYTKFVRPSTTFLNSNNDIASHHSKDKVIDTLMAESHHMTLDQFYNANHA